MDGGDAARLEALAFCYGATYDSYLATEPDRQIFWSGDGQGAMAYVRDGRYVHAAGGLLAAPADRRALLNDLVDWADHQQLVLSLYNLIDEDIPLVRVAGFQVTKWGEEALVDLRSCSWSGNAFQWVRRQSSFCRRHGLVVRECRPAQMPDAEWATLAAELEEVSRAFLIGKPQRNLIRFLEGRFDRAHLGRRRLFVAVADDGGGRVEGFLLCNPCLDGRRWAFETYRRRADAVRGTMPYLMHQAMLQLQAEGVSSVSLCLVPGLNCERPMPGDSALARRGMVAATRYFNFIHDTRGMYHYKSRFRPTFVSRYLAVRPKLTLASAWSFVRVLGVLDLDPAHLARQALSRLSSAAARRTLSMPDRNAA